MSAGGSLVANVSDPTQAFDVTYDSATHSLVGLGQCCEGDGCPDECVGKAGNRTWLSWDLENTPKLVRVLDPLPEGDRRQALVVVPTSTIANWQREFKTWGCFRLVLGHGARKKDAIAQALEGGCDVLLTTPATLLNNTEEIGEIKWTAAIFDTASNEAWTSKTRLSI